MIDLHTHLGGAVPASVLWEILCDAGLQTEFSTFDELQNYLTVRPGDIKSLDDFLSLYFHATELIQSSPFAASSACYQAVAKAYRRSQIKGIELRYNPLKRLRKRFHTLDSIILASLQGFQRASMHYNVKTGIIFSMGKELSIEENQEIIDAALRFSDHGVIRGAFGLVGIDMAGPESIQKDKDKVWLKQISKMVKQARKAKLGVTWHVGETESSGPEGIMNVIKIIEPDRIGHGIEIRKAKGKMKDGLCGMLRERQICLELCPSVNVVTRSIERYADMAEVIMLLTKEKIPFCLNTDNPYLIHTNLKREYDLIQQELEPDFPLRELCEKASEKATFLKKRN